VLPNVAASIAFLLGAEAHPRPDQPGVAPMKLRPRAPDSALSIMASDS
jgi:hypothetical protein